MKHPIRVTVLLLATALALAACGKRPKFVDQPLPEGQTSPFPRSYPNPALDPKPSQPSSGVQFP